MDSLFNHKGFKLIHVDDNGNMSLVALTDHREDIVEESYRCISHLWGNATRWEDHPVKDVAWRVDIREEKREKLLQILNHYKGYWWVDVFCTNQEDVNKPLSIMGDVYKNCKECICMLDIRMPDFLSQSYEIDSKSLKMIFEHGLEVLGCEWNKRVWTFQEWILPPKAYYTSEIVESNFCIISSDTYVNMFKEADKKEGINSWSDFKSSMQNLSTGLSICMMFSRKRDDFDILETLMKSGRKCKDHRDYYYGIAGVFGYTLTDGLSFSEVEKEFFNRFNIGIIRIKRVEPKNDEESIYKSWKIRGVVGRPVGWIMKA